MAKLQNVFSLKTFCVITGASKGFGKTMALRFSELFPDDSFMLLLARSKEGLENTKEQILKKAPGCKVGCFAVDLATQNESQFATLLKDTFTQNSLEKTNFQQALIVHNVGSLGDVSKTLTQQNSTQDLRKYWDLNLSSVVVLNSIFIDLFRDVTDCSIQVLNISSICALQPFKSWSLYCAGKAARDMLFRTMAEEEGDIIRILNYAPGPIDTDMQADARTLTADDELRTMFADMKEGQKLLSPDLSVGKLIGLLRENSYESGAHIDYYDI